MNKGEIDSIFINKADAIDVWKPKYKYMIPQRQGITLYFYGCGFNWGWHVAHSWIAIGYTYSPFTHEVLWFERSFNYVHPKHILMLPVMLSYEKKLHHVITRALYQIYRHTHGDPIIMILRSMTIQVSYKWIAHFLLLFLYNALLITWWNILSYENVIRSMRICFVWT